MNNHFRTLLINKSYTDLESPAHIPSSFSEYDYDPVLSKIFTLLYPANISVTQRLAVGHNLLKVVQAAGLEADLGLFDSRLTYPLDTFEFFKYNQISGIVSSHEDAVLKVYGTLGSRVDRHFEEFTITQDSSSLVTNITMSEIPTDVPEFSLVFTAGVSQSVSIPTTDLTFRITTDTAAPAYERTWVFRAEAPIQYDIRNLLSVLENETNAIDEMLLWTPKFDTTNYENLWRLHDNPVYRIAGLLLAFVARLDQEYGK